MLTSPYVISDSHRQATLSDGKVVRELMSVRDLSGGRFAPMADRDTLRCHDMYGEMPLGSYILPQMTVVPIHRGDFGYICVGTEPVIEQNADFLRKGKFLRARFSEMIDGSIDHTSVGDLVVLTSRCHNNFWHWMMDSLPKIFIAESSGFRGDYLVPSTDRAPWATESLSLLGIPDTRLIRLSGVPVKVDRLYLPTYFCGYNAHINRDFARAYRSWLLERISLKSQRPGRRILIGRHDSASARRVLNQSELAMSLAREGFEQIYFERFSLREQMRIASEAAVLVGGHGSGLTHLFLMPENGLVLELFPYRRQQSNNCYEALSTIVPHRYRALESHVMREGDIEVDLESARKILLEESVI
jgi:hypothetical protein